MQLKLLQLYSTHQHLLVSFLIKNGYALKSGHIWEAKNSYEKQIQDFVAELERTLPSIASSSSSLQAGPWHVFPTEDS